MSKKPKITRQRRKRAMEIERSFEYTPRHVAPSGWIDRTASTPPNTFGPGRRPVEAYVDSSNSWIVQIYRIDSEALKTAGWVGTRLMGISRYSKPGNQKTSCEIVVPWSVIQSIKNDFYEHAVAVEAFPPDGEVVDVAPMRWLWILPPGAVLPFNLGKPQILESK